MAIHGAYAHAIQRGIRNELSKVSEVITVVSRQCSHEIIGNSTNTVIAQITQPIVKPNTIVSIKTLIAENKMFMNYITSYKKAWLAKQRALEMIHENREESYAKLPKVLGALQSCVTGTVVTSQTESV